MPVRSPDETVTEPVRNVLFVMCDQLRADALACDGGLIDTPNIDRLAARGVRFDNAHIQGTVCGSSRMSFYTGRYVQSHGARYNRIPLSIGQPTLGDHLRPLGIRTMLAGKTHHVADRDGLARLGLDPDAPEAMYVADCGFEPTERDDGLHPDRPGPMDVAYNRFLRAHGFDEPNPWHTSANSVLDDDGNRVSGWLLRASKHPAIVPDELSETAFMCDRAIETIRAAGDDRWCLHLSFIKPHWPYVVSEPWLGLVDPADVPSPTRADHERATDHPVLRAFQRSRVGRTFSDDDVRRTVVPAYLGLVAQIDHHLGRVLDELDRLGRTDDTMIVLTSDHGDYLGDHWMGEKDWFHDPVVKVPLIVVDPRSAADATRGMANHDLVEAIDLVPTFLDACGGDLGATADVLEGDSLVPTLHGAAPHDTDATAVSESEFGYMEMAELLPAGTATRDCRATMLRHGDHKYILCETGPDLLYDLAEDPHELVDRHDDPAKQADVAELRERLFAWYRRRSNETTAAARADDLRPSDGDWARQGIFIGYWDEDQASAHGAADHLGT